MTTGSPQPVRIVCATSLAGGKEAFETIGSVRMVPESEINRAAIRDTDVLVTRSKVNINDELLADSRLRFYGTATAGFDHVNVPALERRGIAWSQAPGSNANSVAEYVIAALCWLGLRHSFSWKDKTLGIVGAGQVGSRLQQVAEAMGMRVLLNDPPLREQTGDAKYRPLDDVIRHADVVSLHVPLSDDNPHATRGMVDAAFFSVMQTGSVFINASRGEVVREADLKQAAREHKFSAVVLDVFDHEPEIDEETLDLATLASPHVAGYSLDGRLKGTEMVYRAACRSLGLEPRWKIPDVETPTVITAPENESNEHTLFRVILAAFNPEDDDRRLRELPEGVGMGRHFQRLRSGYPERREFRHFAVKGRMSKLVSDTLSKLGFIIQPPD